MSLVSSVTSGATALSNLILVSPQATIGYLPQSGGPQGVPNNSATASVTANKSNSLLFHYEGENTATLKSDITDHYIENNSAIQDMIALRPEMITVHGFIGELNDIPPGLLAFAQGLANKLLVLSAYTPNLSITALSAYNEAFQLYQVVSNAVDAAVAAWSALTGTGGENIIGSTGLSTKFGNQTKQQTYFQQFYAYWRNRTLFTVQTPWAVFQNMAIEEVKAVQDETTTMITDFQVTFKMLRFAVTSDAATLLKQARAATQSAGVSNSGSQTGQNSISAASGAATLGGQQ